MILELMQLPSGEVSKADIVEVLAERIRTLDPKHFGDRPWRFRGHAFTPSHLNRCNAEPTDWAPRWRVLDDRFLRRGGYEVNLHRAIQRIPKRFRDIYQRLLIDPTRLAVPVGFDPLVMFAMLLGSDSGAVPFSTVDVQQYGTNSTTTWTKPSLPKRFTVIELVGGSGSGGGGAKVTTSGDQAAGGGGGGGGGLVARAVILSTLSTGNVVLGVQSVSAAGASVGDTAGANGAAGGDATFAGLTAGGGAAGTGGARGTGAQTGAGGNGGTGDVAGGNGGTGRSGSTAGDNGNTSAGGMAGGAGGGGATADTAQGAGGTGANGYSSGAGGGTSGAAGGTAGGAGTKFGASGGGGGGSDASNTAGGNGGGGNSSGVTGGGSGGGGGRARNAATTTGNGGSAVAGTIPDACIISF